MSYRIATYVSLLFIIGLGVLIIGTSMQFSTPDNQPVGPAFFPQVVSVLMILMSIVSIFTTKFQKKSEDEKIEVLNASHILFTIVFLIVFTLLWDLLGFSYILSFLFLLGLFYMYNQNSSLKKRITMAVSFSIIMNLFVFLVFEQLLNVVL